MDKQTADMTKAELVKYLAEAIYGGTSHAGWASRQYGKMTKDQLVQQVQVHRGEITPSQLTYKYDH